VYDGSLSGGGFVAFCFVAAQVTMAAAAVPMLLADSRRAAAAARRVVDVLQRQPRLPHRGGLTLQSVQGRVTWRGVSLRRPPHDIVVDADVDAPAGAARAFFSSCPTSLSFVQPRCAAGLLTAIVGEPGSGGLSLALLATRMESPSSGCVTLDDTGES
jgi:ABC-type multidrug transport system fused ATPase/permease subunit